MKSAILSLLGTALIGAECMTAVAQTNEVAQTNDVRGQLSAKDFRFAKAAARGGQMEVTLGQLAAQNGQDQSVRDFGTKMVQDHQAANQQLMQLLSQKGASVSTEPGWMGEHMVSHFQGLKGADFDKAYIKDMVKDHEKDIKEFQKEADSGEDADLKNFASKTLPTLQDHLRMANDAQTKLASAAVK